MKTALSVLFGFVLGFTVPAIAIALIVLPFTLVHGFDIYCTEPFAGAVAIFGGICGLTTACNAGQKSSEKG